ncbi:uncharacterized protein LOC101852004 [Aplysia californica]|uniref:Uncharacterized protein LOC101852004 n=1 Tax=Aplysia californica TaxID=6500 RepID=A0ABM0JG12_APLCA|nr:uncharacterized protein LOC101852004 [Aplysia californica]
MMSPTNGLTSLRLVICWSCVLMTSSFCGIQAEKSSTYRSAFITADLHRNRSPNSGGTDLQEVVPGVETFQDSTSFPENSPIDTPQVLSWSDPDFCDRFEVNGCSIPFGLPFVYKQTFTPSCNRHDVCYQCGIAYDIPRSLCDTSFRDNMRGACEERYQSATDHAQELLVAPRKTASSLRRRKRKVLRILKEQQEVLRMVLRDHFSQWLGSDDSTASYNDFWRHAESVKDEVVIQWALLLISRLSQNHDPSGDRKGTSREEILEVNRPVHAETKEDTRQELKEDNSLYFQRYEKDKTANAHSDSVPTTPLLSDKEDENHCLDILSKVEKSLSPTLSYPEPLTCIDVRLLFCYFIADVYYIAVFLFGESSYRQNPASYCSESFVPQCLPTPPPPAPILKQMN